MLQVSTSRHQFIDVHALPDEYQGALQRYITGILANEEVDSYQGRWLLRVSFIDVADDETSPEIVQQLADELIGFHEYPFDGISWDILGVEPSAYARYVQAMRYLRAQLPAEIIEKDELHLLV